ncbi:MAG: hypothetical protein JW774_09015, partial [Candidatus Aureabacteria bacterium]|nr:hypothetical protein [Candidatus Auribacterota bacterium]
MTAKKTLLKILLSVTAAVLFMSAASLNPFAGVPSQNEGAKKNEVICPYCQYKNSPDDEYCLDCSKSIRNDTPARLLAMEKIKESRRGFITDEKRLAIYQEAIEIDPSFTEPYFLRMQLLRSMKDKNPEGMMADIQKCIELDPENDKYYFER